MATVSKWTPFGVALDVTATAGKVTRTSATQFKVAINASWETYYSGAQTNYGMSATSGGVTKTISSFGTKRSSGSSSFTGTYSISGNGAATKNITVTFKNYEEDSNGNVTESATKNVSFNVTVPAWTSYQIAYNANGGSGAPSAQTKWKDQTLKLSTTKPTRTGYNFSKWNTTSSGSGTSYSPGANYTANAAATLYAQWTAITYTVTYNANGGTGAPGSQTKTYGKTLTLSSTKPTRTGYEFLGWATSASATSATYSAGGSYVNNAAITLYAVWKLSYTKPRIIDIEVCRVDADGAPRDDGSHASIAFTWQTDRSPVSIDINIVTASDNPIPIYSETHERTEGNEGYEKFKLTEFDLDIETSYVVTIKVTDSGGSTSITRTICGIAYTIDGLAGGNGVAFGKPADLEGYMDVNYNVNFRKPLDSFQIAQNNRIFGIRPYGIEHSPGEPWEAFQPQNENGNTVIGWSNYDKGDGNTNVYGHDVHIGVSNIANKTYFRPYRRREDTITLTLYTAGFVTNTKKDVWFWIPISVPIVGSPTVTITSGTGFCLRQGESYTHGSSATVSAKPDSYEATMYMFNGIHVRATFSNTTNVTNNAPIGIVWNGTITFS